MSISDSDGLDVIEGVLRDRIPYFHAVERREGPKHFVFQSDTVLNESQRQDVLDTVEAARSQYMIVPELTVVDNMSGSKRICFDASGFD